MITKLKQLASDYARTFDGKWLNDFDWQNVPVKFKKLKNGADGYRLNDAE